MNKRQLHHFWTRFRLIKPWYFLVAALICLVVCLFALRANSNQMAELRDAVYAADRDNGDVQGTLNDLQAYVTAHMNTSLNTGNGVYPPVQLQYTYERLVQQQTANQQTDNDDLYTQAQAYCQAQNPSGFSGQGRVPCIQQYVKDNGAATNLANKISPSLYQFDFVAPRWSPDLAGWTLLLTILLTGMGVIKFGLDQYIKRKVA